MFDPQKTRERYFRWLKSPDFANYYDATFHKLPRWKGKIGLFLLVVPLLVFVLFWLKVVSADAIKKKWGDEVMIVTVGSFWFGLIVLLSMLNDRVGRWRSRRKIRKELEEYEVILCGIIVLNSALLKEPGVTAPALLVGALAPCSREIASEIERTVLFLGELYGRDPASVPPEMRFACEVMNDDEYKPHRRRPVPEPFTGSQNLVLFDSLLHTDHWKEREQEHIFVACAVHSGREGVILHLPQDLPAWTESGSGAPILRHDKIVESDLVADETPYARQIEEHLARHIGEGGTVFHEMISNIVHVDIHFVPPAPGREWHTLVTSGMSTLPMTVPPGAEHLRRAELMLRLPADWPLTQEALKDEANWWPVRWLKQLVRFPHLCQTWLSAGHSMPNGEPAMPLHKSAKFDGWVLTRPSIGGEGFETLECADGELVHFFSIIPVYGAEMSLKLREGFAALEARLAVAGVTDLVDVRRASVA